MRFNLTFIPDNKEQLIPINYQNEIASWINKILHTGNDDFAKWLHDKGYMSENKPFELFTLSNLIIPAPGFRLAEEDRMEILANEVYVEISFQLEEGAESFITSLFQEQTCILGDKKSQGSFLVKEVTRKPAPKFQETMTFRAISPICLADSSYSGDKKIAKYLSPTDTRFEEIFFDNLLGKFMANQNLLSVSPDMLNEESVFRFLKLSEARSRLVPLKNAEEQETKVRGFLFDFKLTAPIPLLKLGYNAGFGENSSNGFGCVSVMKSL